MTEGRENTWIDLKGQAEESWVGRVQGIAQTGSSIHVQKHGIELFILQTAGTLPGRVSGNLRSTGDKGTRR